MHYLPIFLAVWAVVGGTWAWSSSEVSCASCGSECQAACGTRNFRACCFNFQRRRRDDPLSHSSTVPDESDSQVLQGLVKPGRVGARDLHLAQVLRSLSRSLEGPLGKSLLYRDHTSYLPPVLDSSEEQEVDDDLLTSRGGDGGAVEDSALSHLVTLALNRPPPTLHQRQQALRQRYLRSSVKK